MSYTFLQEQGEESSVECFSDIPQSVLLKLNLIADESCSNGNETESCQSFQYGMMSAHSTGNLGEEKLMSFVGDSLAKTYQSPTQMGKGLMENDLVFGLNKLELLARYCPNTHSLKTHQGLLWGEGYESLPTLPEWGMIVHGELWEAEMLDFPSREKESGFLPAPVASDGKHHGKEKWIKNSRSKRKANGKSAPTEKITYAYYEADIPPKYFPEISEEMMNWPRGWTGLQQLETDKMQSWLQQHSQF
jgi:hypothetical protein